MPLAFECTERERVEYRTRGPQLRAFFLFGIR